MKGSIYDLIKEFLAEDVNQSEILDSLKKKYEVEISYKPKDNGKGGGKRVIQPVVYGKNHSGRDVIRAFQPFGDSYSQHKPYWRTFRTDKIVSWKPLKKRRFSEPNGYRRDGDDGMSEIYMMANFDTTRYERGGLKKYNDNREKENIENDPLYVLKRNIKKSYSGKQMDFLQKNIEDWQKSAAAKEFNTNKQSVYDMQTANDFGEEDSNYTPTTGVVKKGEDYLPNYETNKPNYTNAMQNGPVTKQNTENNNSEEITDTNGEEFQQHNGESATTDVGRELQQRR